MNRQIRRLGVALMLLFTVLFAQLNFVQVFGQQRLLDNPINTRDTIRDFGQPRGLISTADGVIVAQSVLIEDAAPGDFERQREYPEGRRYGHITGFFSFNYGAEGVEQIYNDELAGQTLSQQYDSFSDLFRDEVTTADITLTIDSRVQEVAQNALGQRKGSVVAIDPRTGAILAMWSFPSYDPNLLSTLDLAAADRDRGVLLADPDQPMLPRAYRETFFPGSTFKVVTAAAGVESGVVTQSSPVFEDSDGYMPPLTTAEIANFAGSTCGGDLYVILQVSCNTAFAEMGAELLGPGPMIEMAERFGFNQQPPLDLPAAAPSRFPTDFGEQLSETDGEPPVPIVENTPALAQASIGQNDVSATPLQMAMVAGAVANGGVIMEPHVVADVRDRTGQIIEETAASVWRAPLRPSTAETLRQGMISVVTVGTAGNLAVPGFEVGGKTGTAQVDAARPDDTHAWIIGFAGPPGETPTVAVAVILESVPGAGQQTGGVDAAPIAQQVLAAALNR